MKLGLNLQASLQQTLTPQQIQYLKLLQLSALQFEQHVRSEVETNPMLEELREAGDMDEASEPTIRNRTGRKADSTGAAVETPEAKAPPGKEDVATPAVQEDLDGFEF